MYSVLTIFSAVFFILTINLISVEGTLDCGIHGRVLACPCPRTCSNPKGPHFCPCIEGCSCSGGYLLDETINKCVPPEECPRHKDKIIITEMTKTVCPEDSHLAACPCKKTCDNPKGPLYCECKEGCACNYGYLYDELSEKCIPSSSCNKKINVKVELTCGSNSHIESCPCKKTCKDPKGPALCLCKEGCTCDDGYLLDEDKNVCIRAKHCPKLEDPFGFDPLFKLFDLDPLDPFKIYPTTSTTTEKPTTKHTGIIDSVFKMFDNIMDSLDPFSEMGKPTESSSTPKVYTSNKNQRQESEPIVVITSSSSSYSTSNFTVHQSSPSTSTSTSTSSSTAPSSEKSFQKSSYQTSPDDIIIFFDQPSKPKKCQQNSHFSYCSCERTCTNPYGPDRCPCKDECVCDVGYLRDESTKSCVYPQNCFGIDVVEKTVVVKSAGFWSWCCSLEEPTHLFLTLLISCLFLVLLFTLISSFKKKRRPYKLDEKMVGTTYVSCS